MHQPVLIDEILGVFDPKPGEAFIDATLGDGGHAEAVLDKTSPDGLLLGIERDPVMASRAGRRLKRFGERAIVVTASYADITSMILRDTFPEASGILFDLGVASHHFDASGRGFSFRSNEPLDMRFNPDETEFSAADILNGATEETLERIFREYGGEREAHRVARAVVQNRPILTTRMFADLIAQAKRAKRRRIHPATQVFQALRIVVNEELTAIEHALPEAIKALRIGGTLAVIAYHSLEDRIVKQFMREQAKQGTLTLAWSTPIRPGAAELSLNLRSRSARLRAAHKIS